LFPVAKIIFFIALSFYQDPSGRALRMTFAANDFCRYGSGSLQQLLLYISVNLYIAV